MQAKVQAFLETHGLQLAADIRYIDLASEVGEVGKALLKASGYGTCNPAYASDLTMELGDCLFSLLALCTATGVHADTALEMALAKYRQRYAEKGSIGS